MSSQLINAANNLFGAQLHRYSHWPNPKVPDSPGVYAVWEEQELVWVGSVGGSLRSRLDRHVKGQRRGSEFLKAVYARLMFRHMGLEKAMRTAGETQLLVDAITGRYVRQQLAYRYLSTEDESSADKIAQLICSGKTPYSKPFLNPID